MGTRCPPRSWPCQIEAFFLVGSFARRELGRRFSLLGVFTRRELGL